MGRFRGRLRKLEEAAKGEIMPLVCPECGAEFVAYGDVPMEYIVHHEHDPGAFLEKDSGLPLLSREVSGIDIGARTGDEGGA